VLEEKNREHHEEEFELLMRQRLEEDLAKMIAKINEVNEICMSLGRSSYMYEPTIITEIQSDGKKIPKVSCKAYPDR
jgi:hypothetical protein